MYTPAKRKRYSENAFDCLRVTNRKILTDK